MSCVKFTLGGVPDGTRPASVIVLQDIVTLQMCTADLFPILFHHWMCAHNNTVVTCGQDRLHIHVQYKDIRYVLSSIYYNIPTTILQCVIHEWCGYSRLAGTEPVAILMMYKRAVAAPAEATPNATRYMATSRGRKRYGSGSWPVIYHTEKVQ